MREIVLDTETTGLSASQGDRIVQIGVVELWNYLATGKQKQWTINPERPMPLEAAQIHHLTDDILLTQPRFIEIVDDFLAFIGDSSLIIHNARFDVEFLNAELKRVSHAPIGFERVIDTMDLARERYPGMKLGLDDLCKRFGIDRRQRIVHGHGALLDAELLASCYLELRGGRQVPFDILVQTQEQERQVRNVSRVFYPPRPHGPSEEERIAHAQLIDEIPNSLWHKVR